MKGGYTGKILRVDLTNKSVSTISTEKYIEFGGGHGMGSAIFFDLVKDKTIDGFDPANVVTLMTSPFCSVRSSLAWQSFSMAFIPHSSVAAAGRHR